MIALIAIRAFLSRHVLKIGLGVFVLLALWYGVRQIQDAATSKRDVQVLEQTIKNSNEHVRIEEKQSEIYNRTLSDDELFDSLQSRTF